MTLGFTKNGDSGLYRVVWEIIKWLFILTFLAGGAFVTFETTTHADKTYLRRDAFEQFEKYNNERWSEVKKSLDRIEAKLDGKRDKSSD